MISQKFYVYALNLLYSFTKLAKKLEELWECTTKFKSINRLVSILVTSLSCETWVKSYSLPDKTYSLGDREVTVVSSTMTKVTKVVAIWAANFAFDKFTDLDIAEFIKKVFEKKYQ